MDDRKFFAWCYGAAALLSGIICMANWNVPYWSARSDSELLGWGLSLVALFAAFAGCYEVQYMRARRKATRSLEKEHRHNPHAFDAWRKAVRESTPLSTYSVCLAIVALSMVIDIGINDNALLAPRMQENAGADVIQEHERRLYFIALARVDSLQRIESESTEGDKFKYRTFYAQNAERMDKAVDDLRNEAAKLDSLERTRKAELLAATTAGETGVLENNPGLFFALAPLFFCYLAAVVLVRGQDVSPVLPVIMEPKPQRLTLLGFRWSDGGDRTNGSEPVAPVPAQPKRDEDAKKKDKARRFVLTARREGTTIVGADGTPYGTFAKSIDVHPQQIKRMFEAREKLEHEHKNGEAVEA